MSVLEHTEELLTPQLDHRGKRCCSVCGCTEDRACVIEGLRCAWVGPTLCSCCAWAEPGQREITLTPTPFGTEFEVAWP